MNRTMEEIEGAINNCEHVDLNEFHARVRVYNKQPNKLAMREAMLRQMDPLLALDNDRSVVTIDELQALFNKKYPDKPVIALAQEIKEKGVNQLIHEVKTARIPDKSPEEIARERENHAANKKLFDKMAKFAEAYRKKLVFNPNKDEQRLDKLCGEFIRLIQVNNHTPIKSEAMNVIVNDHITKFKAFLEADGLKKSRENNPLVQKFYEDLGGKLSKKEVPLAKENVKAAGKGANFERNNPNKKEVPLAKENVKAAGKGANFERNNPKEIINNILNDLQNSLKDKALLNQLDPLDKKTVEAFAKDIAKPYEKSSELIEKMNAFSHSMEKRSKEQNKPVLKKIGAAISSYAKGIGCLIIGKKNIAKEHCKKGKQTIHDIKKHNKDTLKATGKFSKMVVNKRDAIQEVEQRHK